ncbi:hypothetical protein [Planctomicrobium sp. SH664]|uniref:hypothetical protein n=1 Tax=Planctomicrobium sp. SH664 TaxID=3448125 RepID=UPI003F5BC49E
MYKNASTGLAILRRDGFASMQAQEQQGTLTTRPVTFTGNQLFVNVKAPQGELRVEILDEAGKPIAPFTRENCQPVSVDSTRTRISWNQASDLSQFSGRPVRLRFSLSNGELYSFWGSPDVNGASLGYVAAGGPEFSGPRDLPSP